MTVFFAAQKVFLRLKALLCTNEGLDESRRFAYYSSTILFGDCLQTRSARPQNEAASVGRSPRTGIWYSFVEPRRPRKDEQAGEQLAAACEHKILYDLGTTKLPQNDTQPGENDKEPPLIELGTL